LLRFSRTIIASVNIGLFYPRIMVLNLVADSVGTRGLSRVQTAFPKDCEPAVLRLGSAQLWVSALALLYQSGKGWPTQSGRNLMRLAISCRRQAGREGMHLALWYRKRARRKAPTRV